MPGTILIFPTKSWRVSQIRTGIKLKSLRRGGHISTDGTVRKYWPQIKRFFQE